MSTDMAKLLVKYFKDETIEGIAIEPVNLRIVEIVFGDSNGRNEMNINASLLPVGILLMGLGGADVSPTAIFYLDMIAIFGGMLRGIGEIIPEKLKHFESFSQFLRAFMNIVHEIAHPEDAGSRLDSPEFMKKVVGTQGLQNNPAIAYAFSQSYISNRYGFERTDTCFTKYLQWLMTIWKNKDGIDSGDLSDMLTYFLIHSRKIIENARNIIVNPPFTPFTVLFFFYLEYSEHKSKGLFVAQYVSWLLTNLRLKFYPDPSFSIITWDNTWGTELAKVVLNNLDEIFFKMMKLIHPGISPPPPTLIPYPFTDTGPESLIPGSTKEDKDLILKTYKDYLRSAVKGYRKDRNKVPVHEAVIKPNYELLRTMMFPEAA